MVKILQHQKSSIFKVILKPEHNKNTSHTDLQDIQ